MTVCGITRPLGRLSPVSRQVPHVLRTRSPVALASPRDLHVLSTPPAFVLSQDQTLQEFDYSSAERDHRIRSNDRIRNHRIRVCSLPAAHVSSRLTRATARFSHTRLSISEFSHCVRKF